MIRRNTNRGHMIDDHHGPGTGRANLLVRAVDGILGTHRILLVFDPWRSAVLLVAGDRSGQWARWYRTAIPQAEQLYEDYLAEREKEMGL
jgi:hypothetical protein